MAIGETNYREKTDTDHIEESIKEIKEDMNSNFLNIDTKLEELKKSVADGKNLIGSVIGGNSSSTFATLANNAQNIKTDMDNKLLQVNSLNSQLTNLTNDRNNWKNIANGKIDKSSGILSYGQSAKFKIPINENYRVIAHHIGTLYQSSIYYVSKKSAWIYLYCDYISSSDGDFDDSLLVNCSSSTEVSCSLTTNSCSILNGTVKMIPNDGLYFDILNNASTQIQYYVYGG